MSEGIAPIRDGRKAKNGETPREKSHFVWDSDHFTFSDLTFLAMV